ncbi:MAG: cysteine--tRNA ligase [Alphaproteobacteria bacterium]|nr:cysteine--tRNA ligase [Alphaproteobacteria bacterium]
MTLHIHNTLTRQKEVFEPLDPSHVRMYVCGPTVYDWAHIGNARPVVVFDTLYRLLKRHYPKVTYVRNITDVDDKIIARAKESNISIKELTLKTTEMFHQDMGKLNALHPDFEPRATDYIGPMIALIEKLLAAGHAYEAEGHVLFSVPSMADYGQLSRLSRKDLVAGARVEVAPYKKDPADFVLWKPASEKDGQGWDSPFGFGRPGWHIECSAMAEDRLGETFDIHGGGLDLIFPHHENEIAQSRCAHNGKPFARYWVHNGFLVVNGEKMSKSLGNFYTVHELLEHAPGEALRLSLLGTHYRQPYDFTLEGLAQNKATLDKWYSALRQVKDIKAESSIVDEAFEEALLDDLNTPLAISRLHELVRLLNSAEDEKEKAQLKACLLASANAMGLLQQDPELWLQGQADEAIESQINARLEARKARNFAKADEIRDALAAQGIILEDNAQGTTWRRM